MKQMTSAEFARANLTEIDGPVQIRRYTKVMGTYYPEGYEPQKIEVPSAQIELPSALADIAPASTKAAAKIIEELTEEVQRLKKELAARPTPITDGLPESWRPSPAGLDELVSRERRTVPRPRRDDDPFANLAKQDREFFERKLGKKK